MALDISRAADSMMRLDDVLAAFDADPPSVRSEETRNRAAGIMARLALDRECVANAALAEIEQGFTDDRMIDDGASDNAKSGTLADRRYGPQVLMLGEPRPGWFLRANIWPAQSDYALRASGDTAFSYGLAHDHNFDFLTIGYHGPGYVSDYYEQDYDALAGYRGEPARLRFIERSALHKGRILYYRKHRDVHCQYPPEQLSISLNLMFTAPEQHWYDQYRHDLDSDRIDGIVSHGASDVLLRLAVEAELDEGLELAETVLHLHPSGRLRGVALDALHRHLSDEPQAQARLLERAMQSDSALVAGQVRQLALTHSRDDL
ncbi:MAG: transposase [Pseudomonadota bacterium]